MGGTDVQLAANGTAVVWHNDGTRFRSHGVEEACSLCRAEVHVFEAEAAFRRAVLDYWNDD